MGGLYLSNYSMFFGNLIICPVYCINWIDDVSTIFKRKTISFCINIRDICIRYRVNYSRITAIKELEDVLCKWI